MPVVWRGDYYGIDGFIVEDAAEVCVLGGGFTGFVCDEFGGAGKAALVNINEGSDLEVGYLQEVTCQCASTATNADDGDAGAVAGGRERSDGSSEKGATVHRSVSFAYWL